ncbi:DUF3592 domain-containing protein [Streptomyces sp. BI20]|uniref:DUF3592 domain-containing protein n=1 Tax=Streptomyces sp. BI20 TaxID=3403460 RepID=UPI003C747BE5
MEVYGGIAAVVIGLALVHGALAELAVLWRARGRWARAEAVVIAAPERGGTRPGARPGRVEFEFTTAAGAVVRTASSANTFPGPRPGARVRVWYDPVRPEETADRIGVVAAKVVVAPLVVAAAGLLVVEGVSLLV